MGGYIELHVDITLHAQRMLNSTAYISEYAPYKIYTPQCWVLELNIVKDACRHISIIISIIK